MARVYSPCPDLNSHTLRVIIVDSALRARAQANQPIRVGIVGAGAMARGVALQLIGSCTGFFLAAVSNRTVSAAETLYSEAGVEEVSYPENQQQFDNNVKTGRHSVTDDPTLLCHSEHIDVIVEITGAVDFAARVVLDAIEHDKHVVLMNAEVDGTVGPLLKHLADEKGVVITNVDGDQPGVLMNLYRWVQGMGIKPVLCGNIKGLQDPYRTPTTQAAFAERWKQSAPMVTSFADGTKISFEQALVANATGMRVAQRGMFGPTVELGSHVDDAQQWYPIDLTNMETGIVDYVVGASPAPGVFVLGMEENKTQQHLLEMYKMGTGPLYSFYTPYHLCHLVVHNTIARAVLFRDPTITPSFGPCVDVIATAKRDLEAGETLDGIGHYMTYGQCENADIAHGEGLLPIGLAQDCILINPVKKDSVLTYGDVHLPENRLVNKLRRQQDIHFFGSSIIDQH